MSFPEVEHAARTVRSRMTEDIRIAVVLGSGLGGFADYLEETVSFPFSEVPGFAITTAQGHEGKLVIGRVEKTPVLVMQGRFHFYEGYSLEQVTFPIRMFKLLGIKTLILTNAAGSINVQLGQGALMVISDHLNLMGVNPLRGVNDERFGPRFPDMSEVYSRELQEIVVEEARELGVEIRRGIYAALGGPSYETPAEIHMLRAIGADAVGMSTVPEAIVARHMQMDVLAISCITNLAAGITDTPINHDEVIETGQQTQDVFSPLLGRVISRIRQEMG